MMQVLVVDDQRMPRDNMEQILAASGAMRLRQVSAVRNLPL